MARRYASDIDFDIDKGWTMKEFICKLQEVLLSKH